MAITFEVATELVSSVNTPSFTHAGTTPKAVVVTAVNAGAISSTTVITAVTYGGASLSMQAVSRDSAGELGVAWVWALTSTGAAIPTGNQTVAITKSPGNTAIYAYVCQTYAGSTGNMTVFSTFRGLENQNSSIAQTTATKGGELGVTVGAWYSGVGGTNESTFNAGITRVDDHDYGAQCAFVGRETTPSSADFTWGYRQTADDWAMVGLVLREEAGGGGGGAVSDNPFRFCLLGVN